MTNRAELERILDLVSGAKGPDREIDTAIGEAFAVHSDMGTPSDSGFWVAPKLTASVDATLELAARVLPNWSLRLGLSEGYRYPWVIMGRSHPTNATVTVEHHTAPLAILKAALQAKLAQPDPVTGPAVSAGTGTHDDGRTP